MIVFVRKSVMYGMVARIVHLPDRKRTRFHRNKDSWTLHWPGGAAYLRPSPDSDGFDLEVKTRRRSTLSIMSRKAAEDAGVVFYNDL